MASISKIKKLNKDGTTAWTKPITPYEVENASGFTFGVTGMNNNGYVVTQPTNTDMLGPSSGMIGYECGLILSVNSSGKPTWIWVLL